MGMLLGIVGGVLIGAYLVFAFVIGHEHEAEINIVENGEIITNTVDVNHKHIIIPLQYHDHTLPSILRTGDVDQMRDRIIPVDKPTPDGSQ